MKSGGDAVTRQSEAPIAPKGWIWVDRIANFAILIVAVLLIVIVGRRFQARTAPDVSVPVGSHVTIDSVNWLSNRFSVVLVLSTECKFCADNADLYREIAGTLRTKRLGKTVAVFPQNGVRAQEYLRALNVVPDETLDVGSVLSISRATPTIIAVDGDGRVVKSWVGRLSRREAQTVLNEIVVLSSSSQCSSCGS